MAILHASGTKYIIGLVHRSDLETFVKDVFPVLFLHPSIQLLALAVFGIISLYINSGRKYLRILIATLIAINMVFAIYLAAWIPAALLALAAGCFMFSALQTAD